MKNIIIAALVGISFLTSGFWIGLRLAPMPKKPAPVVAKAAPKVIPEREAFSLDALKRTSEKILSVNEALQSREAAVAAREKAVAQKEDELTAERGALDRTHARFKDLYNQFQQRLQLVTDTETGALQRQVTIFTTMDPTQAVDLLRSLDDPTIVRLFALMEDKPLSKLVEAWKIKYPADSVRMLTDINAIGHVVAKDKIDLPDPPPETDSVTPAPPPLTDVSMPASASADVSMPAAATADANEGATTAAEASTAPATDTNPVPNTNLAPESTTASSSASIAPSPAPLAPAQGTTHPASDPAQPASAPSDSNNNNATPAPASSTAPTASASAAPESTLLDSPGETAAKAAASRPASNDRAPSDFATPQPTMRAAHDKPARLASARND